MTMGRNVAVFDFDGTLIRGDSVVALLLYAGRRGCASPFFLLRAAWYGALYHLKLTDALTAKKASHSFLSRMDASQRETFLRDFARTLTERVFADGRKQMQAHRDQGDLVVLCSASCQCYMRYVAELLNVDALLCTPCAPDGNVLGPNCRGEEKVRRVDAWLADNGLTRSAVAAAYGDTAGDAPILRVSRQPVLVNAKKKLRLLLPNAKRVSWK